MMKVVSILLVCLFGIVSLAQGSYVLDLTEKSFDQTLQDNEFVLVEFFAPWCGHCKALAPEYEAAAQQLKDSPIKLAKVDCTVQEELAKKYDIRGFPTIRFFRRGVDPIEYNGPREANGIVAWLNKKTGPAAVSLANADEVTAFVAEKKNCAVGYFDNNNQDTNEAYKNFLAAANEVEDFVFGEAVGVSGKQNGEIVLFREFDEPHTVASGESVATTETITKQLAAHGHPYISEVRNAYHRHAERGVVVALFVVDETVEGQIDSFTKDYTPLAKELVDQIGFVYVPSQFHAQVRNGMGASEQVPTVVVNNVHENKNYPLPSDVEFNLANVEKHIKAVLSGDLAPFFKSEPIPESNDGPVTVLVGHNFEKIALDPSKNVLVEFYAPWCGHCKSLAPVWDQLGEAFQGRQDVIIAKMDATANDNSVVQIQGFPTIYLFPATAEANSHIQYEGGRTLEDFKTWIEEQTGAGAGVDVDAGLAGNAKDEL